MESTTITLPGPWPASKATSARALAACRNKVALYFIASPLQYLAAREIATRHEAGARQVLVWYQPGLHGIIRPGQWDAAMYMPWPRRHPLPGPFGRMRRLRDNIRQVAALVGPAETLHIHSAVFDTEAINYFLHALPRLTGARAIRGRILPDGLINVMRYPLSTGKQLAMRLRSLRGLAAPELRYSRFGGDRIGSDAPFCDRIYVLPELPHEYPADKVVVLPALTQPTQRAAPIRPASLARRALIIGQPLVGAGLLAASDLPLVSQRLRIWLHSRGITEVVYKAHPKDQRAELSMPGDQQLLIDEPLEQWMSSQHFDAVVGVRSTSLVFARQVFGQGTEVCAFGWDRIRFKSAAERLAMQRAFTGAGVKIDGVD